jgi:hypothetical protein
MAAVDCNTDSVVWERDMYDLGRWFEYLDNGLILSNHSDSLTLIDPQTDSVLVDSSLEAGGVDAVTHTGDGEKLYLVRFGRLEVRSSNTLALLKTLDWPYFGSQMMTFLTYSYTAQKLYWFVGEDSVLAIDVASDSVVTRMEIGARAACLDHTGRYLFCACYWDSSLSVYDVQTDSLIAAYPQVQHLVDARLTSSPEQHRVYVACQDGVLSFLDAPPGVDEGQPQATSYKSQASIVHGVLFLAEAPSCKPQAASLLDVSGRKVIDLHIGANDVRALAPGVYFVREELYATSLKPQAMRKIVIAE